jgi:carbonic anhydrase
MAEARKLADMGQEVAVARKPQEVLQDLQRGTARFWTGTAQRPEKSAFERRALISKQFPLTAVLGCSDSRVPVEIVFDQGLGDMFVVRVAGNVVETGTAGSLQYAVNHLKVKVLVVMGHEGCGAVKAAGLPEETLKDFDPALCSCLKHIKSGLDFGRLACVHDPRSHDREAVVTNVKRQVEALTEDPKIMEKVRAGELIVIGAFYEISSGIVDFFFEVSAEAAMPDKLPSRGVQSAYDPASKMERQTSAEERARGA